jgi:4-amino-4-deoxy-L-arabinose transferase-like glycosyltransferase
MTRRRFIAAALAVVAFAAVLRLVWLRADAPVEGGVGIVWHDEGAWTHNARNRALWGVWRTDNWNPVFVAPVFTALEYVSFEAFGVGTWQARVVPAVSGLAAVALLMVGLSVTSGRRVALAGGALLAANYAFVMWNRAALMESTMTAAMVAAWCAYSLGERRPHWGLVAGAAAAAAWFTKASAAFFVAALALDAAIALGRAWLGPRANDPRRAQGQLAAFSLAGLAAAFVVAGMFFVLPYWTEYRFYNWEMSVTRKPEYSLRALVDRASWLPFVQSIFSRMWLELAAAGLGLVALLVRWRDARPGERLLVLWLLAGLAELVVHDSGNERRYVMFIPALIAIASIGVGHALRRDRSGPGRPALRVHWLALGCATAVALVAAYLIVGSALRWLFLDDVLAGRLSGVVRLAAATAALMVIAALIAHRRVTAWLSAPYVNVVAAGLLVTVALTVQLVQFGRWAAERGYYNYQAAVTLGRLLPPGTPVQGKLANGLMLESGIRPIFIGNGFGNYADRLTRDDVRYILTYDLPGIGYESSYGSGLIDGILDRYPQRRTIQTFVVDETTAPDRAALIDKFPDSVPAHARD